ncbi:hypothetical protein PG987_014631 [Apiospora arundinis]
MADDRGPLINGVSWTLAAFSGVVLGLRLIQLVCVILISVNISHGFGKHATELKLSYPEVVQMSLRGAINGTMLILAAAWSKTSFAVTLLRMTKGGTEMDHNHRHGHNECFRKSLPFPIFLRNSEH